MAADCLGSSIGLDGAPIFVGAELPGSELPHGEGRMSSGAPARIQVSEELPEDELERSLRPRRLEDFIGQDALKDQLAVSIEAAATRGEALDHVLLAGPPGLGKTSLAQIVAAELGVPFVQTAGPALERKGDVAAYLSALEPRAVFFVDEIHRLPRALEETFYPAMEDGCLPVTVGQGAGARVLTLELPPFTLIGATTRAGLLSTPLRDRFGIQHRLEHYDPDELGMIVRRSARLLGVTIEDGGARAVAARSRGTPRVANRLLKRVRDYAEVRGSGTVTAQIAAAALDLLQVDHEGLDRLDREILRAICQKFGGGPVGLSTLAVAVGEEQDTIEDVYEPYLLQRGLIERTPRGRAATRRAYAHLGLDAPGPATLL
jgi:Holliday junction DNA helicase RuvB